MYLKGVKSSDLAGILNFMYHGEVNIAQEDLTSFLAVAQDLKIKGLTQSSNNSETTINNPESSKTFQAPSASPEDDIIDDKDSIIMDENKNSFSNGSECIAELATCKVDCNFAIFMRQLANLEYFRSWTSLTASILTRIN